MDRRSLLITGAGLTLGASGFITGARAQSRTAQPDESPPVQSESTAASGSRWEPSEPPADAYGPPRGADGPPPGARGYGRGEAVEGLRSPGPSPRYPTEQRADTFSREEIVRATGDFLGVTAEAGGAAVERIFARNGRPTAYIAGEEGSGAFIGGVRYGKGLVYMKGRPPMPVYWQGPTIGWDWGGNASRVFTLAYNLQYPDAIYRRFPGVEGSAYFIGGVGVNYQRAEDITLAPMRAGLGLRLGANVGYLAYSRKRHWIPL